MVDREPQPQRTFTKKERAGIVITAAATLSFAAGLIGLGVREHEPLTLLPTPTALPEGVSLDGDAYKWEMVIVPDQEGSVLDLRHDSVSRYSNTRPSQAEGSLVAEDVLCEEHHRMFGEPLPERIDCDSPYEPSFTLKNEGDAIFVRINPDYQTPTPVPTS